MRNISKYRVKSKKKKYSLKGGSSQNPLNSQGCPYDISDFYDDVTEISGYAVFKNDDKDSESLEEDIEPIHEFELLTENVINEQIGLSEIDCCESPALHDIKHNIDYMENEVCNINEIYNELLNKQINIAKDLPLERTPSLVEWKQTFSKKYVWQLYNESDLLKGIRYEISQIKPIFIDDITKLNIIEPSIKRLIHEYIYKIISGYFTKSSICYAIYNFEGHKFIRYEQLENTIKLLSCGVTNINYELYEQAKTFSLTYKNNEGYLISGGNIFFVFAGFLCFFHEYLNTKIKYPHSMLNDVLNDITPKLIGSNIEVILNTLFQDDVFKKSITSILSSPSDMDYLFFSKKKNLNPESVDSLSLHTLSASVLRSLLNKAFKSLSKSSRTKKSHFGGTRSKKNKTNKKNSKAEKIRSQKSSPPKFKPIKLFPFIEKYDKMKWGKGKFFNLTNKDLSVCDLYGKMDKYIGYRQSSSFIPELPIYLNRIKQGYYPFTKLTKPDGEACMDKCREKELMSKYGECIDLSIGFYSNPLYKKKYDAYLQKNYYTIDNLLGELEIILATGLDDKSDKRQQRYNFLTMLKSAEYIFNIILKSIFKHIHLSEGTNFGFNDTI